MATADGNIDEGLYSRQMYVLGECAMQNLVQSKVLVSGLGGLGVEIAKNFILTGVGKIVLHDEALATWEDLSSQFYLEENDVGENRAMSSLSKLQGLNVNVTVLATSESITLEFLKDFDLVVFTEGATTPKLDECNEFCRANNVLFVFADCRGVFGRVFCDFGDKFVVKDVEEVESLIVTHISKEEFGLVTCFVEKSHGLQVGDEVLFHGIVGMEEINSNRNSIEHVVTHIMSNSSFRIGNTSEFQNFVKGGTVIKKKKPQEFRFNSLKESIKNPKFINVDFRKNPLQTHLAFCTLAEFRKQKNHLPLLWDAADSKEFIELSKTIGMPKNTNIDEKYLDLFSKTCNSSFGPIAAFLGGFITQEALKGCTRKFIPLQQWMFCDFSECLPTDQKVTSSGNVNIKNDRYYGITSLLGIDAHQKLANLKVFVVGAGAIGCEILKNISQLGIGSGPEGEIIVTDMDFIEKSNLSRQFLFRSTDIKKSKSETAARAILKMNPGLKVTAHQIEVGTMESEEKLGYSFFDNLDIVINALDNVAARKHIDERCVDHKKPLLESGTQGLMGSTQVIVPNLTKCYSDSTDPPIHLIPLCTLKLFPYKIEHTLQWARDLFEENFQIAPSFALNYIKNPNFNSNFEEIPNAAELVSTLQYYFSAEQPTNFLGCLKWARLKYDQLFVQDVSQMIQHFPENHLTPIGLRFWSGTKKFPKPYHFNLKDQLCFEFIFYAANLQSRVLGISQVTQKSIVMSMSSELQQQMQNFAIKDDKKKFQNLDEDSDDFILSAEDIEELRNSLPEITEELMELKLFPENFEKDDDSNFHIDFIVAASNLRASIYSIETVDRLKSKKIVGKIIPAIATTTAVVSGLVCCELIKLIEKDNQKIERYRDSYINLAVPSALLVTPKKAGIELIDGFKWTIWNRPVVQGDVTLCEFLHALKTKYNIEASVISYGNTLIYFTFEDKESKHDKLISQLISEVVGRPISPDLRQIKLIVTSEQEELKDLTIPPIRYLLPLPLQ